MGLSAKRREIDRKTAGKPGLIEDNRSPTEPSRVVGIRPTSSQMAENKGI